MADRNRRGNRYNTHPQKFRLSTSERLSTPKAVHPENLPNKPSIYWLDYIEPNESLRLKTTVGLKQYYNKFYANLPRLENLSRPKTCMCDSSPGIARTASGIPVSALNYCASPRINILAQPRSYDESLYRSPQTKQSGSAFSREPRNNWSSNRKPKAAASPPKERYYDRNTSLNSGNGEEKEKPVEFFEKEFYGDDDEPMYSRVQNPSKNAPRSQTNLVRKRTQTARSTERNSGLKKGYYNRSPTKLPPLTNSREPKQSQPMKRQRSNTTLPHINTNDLY